MFSLSDSSSHQPESGRRREPASETSHLCLGHGSLSRRCVLVAEFCLRLKSQTVLCWKHAPGQRGLVADLRWKSVALYWWPRPEGAIARLRWRCIVVRLLGELRLCFLSGQAKAVLVRTEKSSKCSAPRQCLGTVWVGRTHTERQRVLESCQNVSL